MRKHYIRIFVHNFSQVMNVLAKMIFSSIFVCVYVCVYVYGTHMCWRSKCTCVRKSFWTTFSLLQWGRVSQTTPDIAAVGGLSSQLTQRGHVSIFWDQNYRKAVLSPGFYGLKSPILELVSKCLTTEPSPKLLKNNIKNNNCLFLESVVLQTSKSIYL